MICRRNGTIANSPTRTAATIRVTLVQMAGSDVRGKILDSAEISVASKIRKSRTKRVTRAAAKSSHRSFEVPGAASKAEAIADPRCSVPGASRCPREFCASARMWMKLGPANSLLVLLVTSTGTFTEHALAPSARHRPASVRPHSRARAASPRQDHARGGNLAQLFVEDLIRPRAPGPAFSVSHSLQIAGALITATTQAHNSGAK
jgi:hypothetical protein